MNTKPLLSLSWGMGTQSTALAAMSALGAFDLPKLDLVIAANTGWERSATYQSAEFYRGWLTNHGIQVVILNGGNIRDQGVTDGHMPFYTADGGPLRRQCTREYKIRPIRRYLRSHIGYHPSKPPAPPPGSIISWLGISLDEWQRMKPSGVKFITNHHPLVHLRLTRGDCIKWLTDHDLPVPVKSACIGCPYRSAAEWLDMKKNAPAEFTDAIQFDRDIRSPTWAARPGDTDDRLFIWRDLIPLDTVNFDKLAKDEQAKPVQIPSALLCDGFCHV